MSKAIRNAAPPWLDKWTFVRRVDDGRRGIVVGVEMTAVGELHHVLFVDRTEDDLLRDDLALAEEDPELAELRIPLVVEDLLG